MKKVLFTLAAILGLSLALVATSCGGGGGGSDDDNESPTVVSSVSTAITGSEVFIDGRNVTIWARWCSDHEVTQKEYIRYCSFGVNHPNSYYGAGDNYPAYFVSWYDALVYCNELSIAEGLSPCYSISGSTIPSSWGSVPDLGDATWDAVTCDFNANGYRLPTEAEWEYFARGGNTTNSGQTIYSGSDTIGDVAWYSGDGFKVCEVKKKVANALGLYDMTGNVWEWCWDRYDSISTSTPSDGSPSGSGHVIRGGSFDDGPMHSSIAFRRGITLPYNKLIGFRVVRSAR